MISDEGDGVDHPLRLGVTFYEGVNLPKARH